MIFSGTLVPDATGEYHQRGWHNGVAYYSDPTNTYFLWASLPPRDWVVSLVLGVPGTDNFYNALADPVGTYVPLGTWTGTGTMTKA